MSSLMTAVVELRPDVAGFRKEAVKAADQAGREAGQELEKSLGTAGGRAGRRAGDAAGKGVSDGVGDGARRGGKQLDEELPAAGRRAGTKAGKEIGDQIEKGSRGGIGSLSERLSKAGSSMARTGALMTVGMTLPLAALGRSAFQTAADVEDAMAANEAWYGRGTKVLNEWAEKSADAFNVSQGNVQAFAATIGTSLGSIEDEAKRAETATKIFERIADIRSMKGGNTTEMLSAWQRAYMNEFDPLETQLGVSIRASDVAKTAAQMGLLTANQAELTKQLAITAQAEEKVNKLRAEGKTGTTAYQRAVADYELAQQKADEVAQGSIDTLTQQGRVLATNETIFQRTAKAQGYLAAHASSTTDQIESSKQAWDDLKLTLGRDLLPVVSKLVPKVTELFKSLERKGVFDKLVPVLGKVADVLARALEIFTKLPTNVQTAAIAFAAFGGPVLGVVGSLLKIAGAAKSAIMWLRGVQAASAAANAAGAAGGLAGAGGMLARGGQYGLAALAAGGIAVGAVRGMNWLDNKTGGHLGMQKVVDFWHGKIPGMATGGYVTQPGMAMVGERGPELLHLPAGAQVTPLDRVSNASTTNSVTMHVTVNGASMSPDDLARALERLSRDASASTVRTRRYR